MNIILLFFCMLIVSIIFSKIKIEFQTVQSYKLGNNVHILRKTKNNTQTLENEENLVDFIIIIRFYIFYKIKIFKIKLKKEKIKKIEQSKIISKISKYNSSIDIETLQIIKKLKFKSEKIDLHIKFDIENVLITTFLTVIISTIISSFYGWLESKRKKSQNKSNYYKYSVQPLYKNKNFIELRLNCIFNVNFVHIINVIYKLIKKRRSDENERTSNRRTYGYSYE